MLRRHGQFKSADPSGDGSVRILSENMAFSVFVSAITRGNGETLPEL
jgi:hypothetical protein